jgi:hypothetical protein
VEVREAKMSDDVRAAAERLRAHRAAVDAAVASGTYHPGRGGPLFGWHLPPGSSPYLCPYPESAGQGIAWDRFRDDQAAVVGAYLAEHPAPATVGHNPLRSHGGEWTTAGSSEGI